MKPSTSRLFFPHAQRYLIAGVLTLLPLWVTWIVFNFLLAQLSSLGWPWVQALAGVVRGPLPWLADQLLQPWFHSVLAVAITLVGLYALGWATTRVLGQRLLAWAEVQVDRIPLAKAIYGSTKKLVAAFQTKPGSVQRVVLIDFPHLEMKAVGLVTRTLRDELTGEELAVVYVPTTPNPTSGYLEIVPVSRLVPTDWSLDEAMQFIITGGASAPEAMRFARSSAG